MLATTDGIDCVHHRVLLLHSPQGRVAAMTAEFRRGGYDCASCATSDEWLEFTERFQPAVVLLTGDIAATVAQGIASALRCIAPPPRIVALAGASSAEAASLGVDYILREGAPTEDVLRYVSRLSGPDGDVESSPERGDEGTSPSEEPTRPDRPTHDCLVDESRVARVRESYKRCEKLREPPESERRSEQRHPYSGRLLLSFLDHAGAGVGQPAQRIAVSVWGRDLATYGMGFFAARLAVPIEMHDAARTVSLDRALKPLSQIRLSLPRSGQPPRWLNARVVYFRPTYEGMYACGVEFIGREQ